MYPDSTFFDAKTLSNVNSIWGSLTIEVLARLGIKTVITSPGSRCTPLTVAAAQNKRVDALSFLDERSAAYYALGTSKSTKRPVVLICTSGTAAANYLPAVIEASISGIPLIIITADRPPELQNCSSGQTIDQVKLYGNYVRQFVEISLPDTSSKMLTYLRQTLVHNINLSLGHHSGPIHLNFPFREPLLPCSNDKNVLVDASTLKNAATVVTSFDSSFRGGVVDGSVVEILSSHKKGLIIVGAETSNYPDEIFVDAVRIISKKLGWPVLTDILNPLRVNSKNDEKLISHYDTFLRNKDLLLSLTPDAILQIGILPTSKVLRSWLSTLDVISYLLVQNHINTDPLHREATPIYSDVVNLSNELKQQQVVPDWISKWTNLQILTCTKIDDHMQKLDILFEGKVSWLLSKYLPPKTSIFLANSMSVRYAEYFWTLGNKKHSIYFNRGANGIDGTLSTAMGTTQSKNPSVLLTGDLAFLHDTNGLLSHKYLKNSLSIIVINNNGGGIFEHLPIARSDAHFEQYFATPQDVDYSKMCLAYGAQHKIIHNWKSLVDSIKILPKKGIRILEIKTDRRADHDTLAMLQE